MAERRDATSVDVIRGNLCVSTRVPVGRSKQRIREMAEKKQWTELTPTARKAIGVGAVLELVVTSIAVRDLIRRPADEVRGWKALWFVGLFVQPIGSPLYLLIGRRRSRN